MAHLYNSGDSHRGDFRTDLSQRAAQAAGQASLDGGQAALERFGCRMYTKAPTGKSCEQLNALLFDKALGAAKGIPMKKKPTVDLHLKQSRHGGNNAKIGCNTSKVKVHHWSWICMDFYRLSGARKKVLVPR